MKQDVEQSTPITITGPDAKKALYETLERSGWKLYWAERPFAKGELTRYFAPGLDMEAHRQGYCDPPTETVLQNWRLVLKSTVSLRTLRAYLEQTCHVSNLRTLSLQDIGEHIRRAAGDDFKKVAILQKFPHCKRAAYWQWYNNQFDGTDREVYDMLALRNEPDLIDNPATWIRYVSEVRTACGEQKNNPKRGRKMK